MVVYLSILIVMPEVHYLYQGFMSAIQSKIPQRAVLANTITDLLAIDKDAVYRRLRGDVNFTFIEMATIAKELGISLDSIAEIESLQIRPAQILLTKHVKPAELDYHMCRDHVNIFKFIKDEPNTKIIESGNQIPYYLFYDYDFISRFFMFYWDQASSAGNDLPFHEIIIPEQFRTLQKECSLYARHIKSTIYVLDSLLFQYLVDNIRFFARAGLIKEIDISLIKYDLMEFLDAFEKLTVRGKHEDTGNSVSIYISNIRIETNYSCIESKNLNMSQFKSFLLNTNTALDKQVYTEVTSWIQYLKSMSTLISVSGEKSRTAFFNTQRKIINTL